MTKENKSDDISNFKIVALDSSNYVKPLRIQYKINNIQRNWDYVQTYSSVSILIFNTTRNVIVLVKQFRPSTYVASVDNVSIGTEIDTNQHPISAGYTLELCAGNVDKNIPLEEVAREEVLEECGYDVPAERLKKIFSFRDVSVQGNVGHVFYVEVEDKDKRGAGGGLAQEGEFIEVIDMPIIEFKSYVNSVDLMSPASLAAAAQWFFANVFKD